MSKKIYTNKVASKRELQSVNVNSLMGVDYSASMLNIQDYHATEISNLIKENNILQKRHSLLNRYPSSNTKINGIWKAKIGSWPSEQYIIHVGTSLYLVEEDSDTNQFIFYTTISNNTLANEKSYGWVMNDRLYILSNKYYVLKYDGSWHLNEVHNEVDTYIPTIYTGGTFNNNTIATNKVGLDDINMMSDYVYETFYSGVGATLTNYYHDYSATHTRYYDLSINVPSSAIQTEIAKSNLEITLSYLTSYNQVKKVTLKCNDNISSGNDKYFYFKGTIDASENITQPYISSCTHTFATIKFYSSGRVVLEMNYDFKPTSDGIDNITVKYLYNNTDYAKINGCKIGILYGTGGTRNRLFLSGNPSVPNIDYHTSRRNVYANDYDNDLQDSQDLTYFSAMDYCIYGTTNNKITGYQIMGDGSLMVVKNTSYSEPSIYFRNAQYNTTEITIGGETKQVAVESFPLSSGNIGLGADYTWSLGNLDNDIVILNKDGVFGISSTIGASALNSDYRYAFSRSRLINKELTKLLASATNVATIIYDHKFWITINNNGTYTTFVCDSRHPYKLNDSVDNEYEYEWFRLDGINANEYFLLNDSLYIGSNSGLHKYQDKIEDRYDIDKKVATVGYTRVATETKVAGEITLPSGIESFYDNEIGGYKMHRMKVYGSGYYYKKIGTLTYNSTKQAYELSSDDNVRRFDTYLGTTLEAVYNVASSVVVVTRNATYDDCYDIKISGSFRYDFSGDIFAKINAKYDEIYYIKADNGKYFLYDGYGKLLDLRELDIETPTTQFSISMCFIKDKVIPSYYLTKAYNMGQSTYDKFLRNLTIINDGNVYSNVNMGIYTKNVYKKFELGTPQNEVDIFTNDQSGISGLDYNEYDLFKVDYGNGEFPTSYSVDYCLKFNFIQFVFYNNDKNNSIINNLQIMYTYGFKNKGVK